MHRTLGAWSTGASTRAFGDEVVEERGSCSGDSIPREVYHGLALRRRKITTNVALSFITWRRSPFDESFRKPIRAVGRPE